MIEKMASYELAEVGGGSPVDAPAVVGLERSEILSDEKLFSLCKMFGAQALEARRKFLGLLPEVNKREQAEKLAGRSWLARRGFSSVFEFAAKLAGVSAEQVRNALNLERQFEDKPALKFLLVKGEVSINKLVRVASIASVENQEELAEKVKLLPKSALETLVRDEKIARENNANGMTGGAADGGKSAGEGVNLHGSQMPFFEGAQLPGQPESEAKPIDLDLKLMSAFSSQLKIKMRELLEKGIDVDRVLLEFLERRELEIVQEKERLAREEPAKVTRRMDVTAKDKNAKVWEPSRYISVKVKRVLSDEYGKKCAVPSCRRGAAAVHHTARFALAGAHDPRYLAPLCRDHHLIAHGADVKFWRKRRGNSL